MVRCTIYDLLFVVRTNVLTVTISVGALFRKVSYIHRGIFARRTDRSTFPFLSLTRVGRTARHILAIVGGTLVSTRAASLRTFRAPALNRLAIFAFCLCEVFWAAVFGMGKPGWWGNKAWGRRWEGDNRRRLDASTIKASELASLLLYVLLVFWNSVTSIPLLRSAFTIDRLVQDPLVLHVALSLHHKKSTVALIAWVLTSTGLIIALPFFLSYLFRAVECRGDAMFRAKIFPIDRVVSPCHRACSDKRQKITRKPRHIEPRMKGLILLLRDDTGCILYDSAPSTESTTLPPSAVLFLAPRKVDFFTKARTPPSWHLFVVYQHEE